MIDKLDKSQSHYLTKVMRLKKNDIFSLFNKTGEWEAKILNITKDFVEQIIMPLTNLTTTTEDLGAFKNVNKIAEVSPDIEMKQEIEIGGDMVEVDIPLTIEFFWPSTTT